MNDIAIVGLGNFGKQYENTRHNVGFIVVDFLRTYYGFDDYKSNFKSLITSKIISDTKVYLIKPQTFMNLSGEALVAFANFYKFLVDDIIVIHDDLDMEFGKVKYKTNSGDGGHNGIKDIHRKLGKDIHRIKIGIDKPSHGDVSSYVLSSFSRDELKYLEDLNFDLAKNLEYLLNKDFNKFLTNINIK